MSIFKLNYLEAAAVGILLYFLGDYIKTKVKFLRDYFIPAPVVGGLLFALLNFALHQLGIMEIRFDNILQSFFMTLFFTSVGFAAKLKVIREGGKQLLLMAGICASIIIIQNSIGAAGMIFFGKPALLGLTTGSIPLIGGHGTAGAFGPLLETLGVKGAAPASIAMATFGLIAGGLLGGPVASRLIKAYGLKSEAQNQDQDQNSLSKAITFNEGHLLQAMAILIICMGLGSVITTNLAKIGIVVPTYMGAMIVSATLTNISSDVQDSKLYLPMQEIQGLGNCGLVVFLSMAMMSLALWDLIELAISMTAIACIQVVVLATLCYFIYFHIMGKNYEAAIIISGICGFGLGATPTAMANMNALTKNYGPAPLAYIIIPLTGSLIVDFLNASLITFFINILK